MSPAVPPAMRLGRFCKRRARALLGIAGAIVVMGCAWCCGFVVEPHRQVFVLSFGKPVRGPITQSGLCWKAPWQRATVLDGRTHYLELPAIERLTADRHPLVAQLYATWRVSPAGGPTFLESVSDTETAERHLCDLLPAELDRQISGTRLAEWLDPRGDDRPQAEPSLELCATRVREACRPIAAQQWGIELVDVRIQRVALPERLRESTLAHMHTLRERRRQVEYIQAMLQARQILAAARVEAEAARRQAAQQASLIRGEGHRQADALLNDARRENPQLTELLEALIMRREQIPATATAPAASQPAPLSAPTVEQPASSQPTR